MREEATSEERLDLVRQFEEGTTVAEWVGVCLRAWAGSGEWGEGGPAYRESQGQHALRKLDEAIAWLTGFRGKLADALAVTGTTGAGDGTIDGPSSTGS